MTAETGSAIRLDLDEIEAVALMSVVILGLHHPSAGQYGCSVGQAKIVAGRLRDAILAVPNDAPGEVIAWWYEMLPVLAEARPREEAE